MVNLEQENASNTPNDNLSVKGPKSPYFFTMPNNSMRYPIIIVIAILLCSSCITFKNHYVETFCNEEGAFAKGVNDANKAETLDCEFGLKCPSEVRKIVRKAYIEGYMETMKIVKAKHVNFSYSGKESNNK